MQNITVQISDSHDETSYIARSPEDCKNKIDKEGYETLMKNPELEVVSFGTAFFQVI